MRKCPQNQLICSLDSYDGVKPPRNNCEGCWEVYNERWDLPEGNTTARSKLDKMAWLSRRVPHMELAFDSRPRNILLALEGCAEEHRWVPQVVGVDVSLSNTGVCVIARSLLTGELVTFVGSFGFPLPQKVEQAHTTQRLHVVSDFVCDFYAEALGSYRSCPSFIEDHAFKLRGSNKDTETHELHGAIKKEMFRRFGAVIQPVSISETRLKVFRHGRPEGGKTAMQDMMVGRFPWASILNHDEVDAWSVAVQHLTQGE